jgi:hypothetical protein
MNHLSAPFNGEYIRREKAVPEKVLYCGDVRTQLPDRLCLGRRHICC